eukprot:1126929-Amphidinium_carterae.1
MAQIEGERDTLLQGGPGIEIQEEKPSVYQEESDKFSTWVPAFSAPCERSVRAVNNAASFPRRDK